MSDQLTNEDRSKVLGFLALVTLTLGAWLEYGHGIGLMTCGLAAGFGWFRRR